MVPSSSSKSGRQYLPECNPAGRMRQSRSVNRVIYLSSARSPIQMSSIFDVSPTVDPFTHYYRRLTLLQPIHSR